MIEHVKKISSQTIIFGLGEAVTKVAGLLLLPIYTHILTTDDYGRLSLVALVTTAVSLVLNMGQSSAFFRFYGMSGNGEEKKNLTGTELIFLFSSSACLLVPLIVFIQPVLGPVFKDSGIPPLVRIALIGTFFDVAALIPFATFRAEMRAAQYASLSVVRFLLNIVLNITGIVLLRLGILGVIYANVLTSMLFSALCIILTSRSIHWELDFKLLKRLLIFGLPVIPANIAGWIMTLSNRVFMERYADLEQVGVFSVGFSIAAVLNMVTGWFNTAYMPYAFSVTKHPDAREIYARLFTYSMGFFTLLGLGLSLFASQAIAILTTDKYSSAASVVPLICLSYILFEMNYLFSLGLDLAGKTKYYPLTIGIGAVANISLNVILIPRFQMIGAALAMCLSYFLLPLVSYPIVQKQFHIPYEMSKLLRLAIVTAVAYACCHIVRIPNLWIDFGIKAIVIAAWIVLLFALKYFSSHEIASMKAFIASAVRQLRKKKKSTAHN
jgi:O-antigen/teichoic acid export membrane protein